MCEHKRLKSVNCELFCINCGARLPADFLAKANPSAAEKPPETPKQPAKRGTKKT